MSEIVEEWENFPKTFKWKEAITFIKTKCNNNKELYNHIKKIVMTLIIDGNTTEDEVLLVAILKEAMKNKILTFKEIQEKYEDSIGQDISFLLEQDDESYENYIKKVFENDHKYLRKIVVADIISKIDNQMSDGEKIKIISEGKSLLKYKEKTDRKLMEKLENKVNN